jgi:hypothetical protein
LTLIRKYQEIGALRNIVAEIYNEPKPAYLLFFKRTNPFLNNQHNPSLNELQRKRTEHPKQKPRIHGQHPKEQPKGHHPKQSIQKCNENHWSGEPRQ